jgi:hypothetical protein
MSKAKNILYLLSEVYKDSLDSITEYELISIEKEPYSVNESDKTFFKVTYLYRGKNGKVTSGFRKIEADDLGDAKDTFEKMMKAQRVKVKKVSNIGAGANVKHTEHENNSDVEIAKKNYKATKSRDLASSGRFSSFSDAEKNQ